MFRDRIVLGVGREYLSYTIGQRRITVHILEVVMLDVDVIYVKYEDISKGGKPTVTPLECMPLNIKRELKEYIKPMIPRHHRTS